MYLITISFWTFQDMLLLISASSRTRVYVWLILNLASHASRAANDVKVLEMPPIFITSDWELLDRLLTFTARLAAISAVTLALAMAIA